MKARLVYFVLAVALALSLSACGKKEAEEEKPAAGPATASAPVDPATAATITGTVKLDGAAPKAQRIRMDAEPNCAKLHTTPVMAEDYVVGDKGALANVVVYVKEGLGNRTFPTPTDSVVLDQRGCLYVPHVIAVQVGQPVEIVNSDPTTHNIHPVPSNNPEWNKSQPPKAENIKQTFNREEIAIPVKCNVHPWMKSYVAVLKNPYFKVTGKDGSFEIKNLPPGDYTLVAWHGVLGASTEQKVTVGVKETKSLDFTFKP
ncbi:MAG TPA: carboxypeptidase regulatory-like domain-containing protein [Candidatus Acidoferrales bacterium]|jgi:plastocyanin|nr:carboxypeptidase regulatory-like domain-containing protein [Candidatus Acidoferrales bacterium]